MNQNMILKSDSPDVIYDMREDAVSLEKMRRTSLSNGPWGLTLENGVVGSSEWWNAVEEGKVKVESFTGIIKRVDSGPMGDSAIVYIEGDSETKSWTPWEGFTQSLIGKKVEIMYAKIPPKHPPTPGYKVQLLMQVRLTQ